MKSIDPLLSSRQNLYKLLALGVAYPDKEVFARLQDRTYEKNVLLSLDNLNLGIPDDRKDQIEKSLSLPGISFDDFESEYIKSFETNMPNPGCSLYEGHYRKNESRADILLELKGFYTNFGLFISGDMKEAEDHLSIELEFMYFLTFKEIQSIESGLDVEPYLKCQRDFLQRHLSRWIPNFYKDVNKKINLDFFRNLAFLIDAFINYESNRVSLAD